MPSTAAASETYRHPYIRRIVAFVNQLDFAISAQCGQYGICHDYLRVSVSDSFEFPLLMAIWCNVFRNSGAEAFCEKLAYHALLLLRTLMKLR